MKNKKIININCKKKNRHLCNAPLSFLCARRSIVPGHRIASGLSTRYQRIAVRSLRTLAHGQVSFRFARCSGTALSHTRIHTLVIDASPMIATFTVTLAFAAYAMAQRIARVAGQTRTNWPLLSCIIVAGHTLSICSARIRRTKVL